MQCNSPCCPKQICTSAHDDGDDNDDKNYDVDVDDDDDDNGDDDQGVFLARRRCFDSERL